MKSTVEEAGSAWQIRLYMVPVIGLYTYVILDSLNGSEVDRQGAFLMLAIVVVVLVCGIVTGMRAAAMYYVFLQAAVLQAFTMMALILMGWRTLDVTLFTTSFLIVCLLLVARVCRRIAWPNST